MSVVDRRTVYWGLQLVMISSVLGVQNSSVEHVVLGAKDETSLSLQNVSGVGMVLRPRVQTEEKTHSAGGSVGNAYSQSSMAESKCTLK